MIGHGIDQGNNAGWAIVRGTPGPLGRVLASGVAKTAEDREQVIAEVKRFAESLREPIIAFCEDHRKMPLGRNTRHDRQAGSKARRNAASILGQGASLGKWQHPLELARIELRRVLPNDWFCAMSGMRPKTRREQRQRWSVDYVSALLGRPVGHDEAAAVCIALYGCRNFAPTASGARAAQEG
jgi:hypothetical protein